MSNPLPPSYGKPLDTSYDEPYRNPYGEPHKPKGAEPHLKRVALFSRGHYAHGLAPYGHYKLAHLPVLPVGIGHVDLELRAIPREEYPQLTVLDRIFLKELLDRHLREFMDFMIGGSLMGGRLTIGSLAPNFVLYNPLRAVEVQGTEWHSGTQPHMRDEVKAMVEKGMGFTAVLTISEAVLRSPDQTRAWFRANLNL